MKLIILDRDGVINEDSDDFIKTPDEWIPIKGSLEAIGRLTQAGYQLVVVTNQSGVGRKLLSMDTLGQIHVRMLDYIKQHGGKIECILFCPHTPDDDCHCRKPDTGMYDELTQRLNQSVKNAYSVGDALRDLQAAHTAGAKPILVKTGKGKETAKLLTQDTHSALADTPIFENLAKFADALLDGQLDAPNQ